ncbi:MAG: D-glycero-beta-D-manno-heptose-7-phosphate kinase [Candidatus Firestonebacteria bacterium]
MKIKRLNRIISGFKGKKILVLGDIILDEYVFGKVSRISPEAPIPVVEVESSRQTAGGAAYVASHINNLGGKVFLTGAIGTDVPGDIVRAKLAEMNIEGNGIIEDNERPTSVKTRIIAQHQQIVRIDKERKAHISRSVINGMLAYVHSIIGEADAVIISDYDKGVAIPAVFMEVIKLARKRKIPVCVDPKPTHCLMFKGITVIKPNAKEAAESLHKKITDGKSLAEAGKTLMKKTGGAVLITRGEQGMSLFRKGKPVLNIPTYAREVFDVTGAGDTVISVLALSLACGADLAEAAYLANAAAGVVVGKLGAASVSIKEIKEMLNEK